MKVQTEFLERLSPEERTALAEELKQNGSRFNAFPLSFSQERLWFLNQLEPDSPAYNVPSSISIKGPLNRACLHDSLNEIVRRHETLRTAFLNVGGQPFQTVFVEAPLKLSFEDLSELSPDRAECAADRLVREAARQPFDLAVAPLIRGLLIRLGEQEHILQLTMHHIISDGWSSGVLTGELARIYEDFLRGRPHSLQALPIQYVDYAVWQRDRMNGELIKKKLDYWTAQLNGTDTLLKLPTDRTRGPVQTHAGVRKLFTLSEELTESLKSIARQESATLFMLLVAAFKTLLYRYTGQRSINVGTSIAGRTKEELEGLIGCFLNTLVLHTDLSPESTFRQLLRQVRETALGAYANQDVPVELILDALHLERSTSHNPLFQVMLILQNTPALSLRLADLDITLSEIDTGTTKFDLTFDMKETDRGMVGRLEYNTDLYDDATIDRLLSHFEVCLQGIAANPDSTLATLPIMTPDEMRQATAEWNQTATDLPDVACAHRLLEIRAEQTPDAIAVEFDGRQISYRQLNHRANQLARHLMALGVGTDTRVAICLKRSIELIVALFGTMKAGGAYIPLDPSYPKQRTAFIMEDSQAALILAEQSTSESLPDLTAEVVYLDADWLGISSESGENIGREISDANLAYLIYTSGSTGSPKGVMVTHGSLVNYTQAAAREYDLSVGDRVLQFASINFDTSAEEIYPCLASGATLVLRKDSMLDSGAGFLRKCRDLSLTVLDLPTAYWHEISSDLDLNAFPASVRTVIIGGEKALVPPLVKWREAVDNRVRLINTYGPTEGTIVSTSFEVSAPPQECATWKLLPIGRPVSNVRTYILDSDLQPVPVGIPGELYIGGAGVARGYSGKPDLTAEKFVPDPFDGSASCRLYRTGDLVKYRPDGVIDFLDRIDSQVKVRGFRIEVGEIESVLGQHPDVRENVVLAFERKPGEMRLAAYVVRQRESLRQGADLSDFLKERLPDYMIPSAFMFIDSLPLTPSGKVDRRRLPEADFSLTETREAFAPPRTALEELMSSIWCEILGLERVGIHNNFFDLGGHSLLATRLIAKVRDVIQVELPLSDLFENPTVAGLAAKAEATRQNREELSIPPIERAARDELLPLSFAQERIWFLNKLNPMSASYHVPRAFRLRGPLNVDVMEQVFTELLRRHEVLRTTFPTVEGRPVQAIHPPERFKIKLVDLSTMPKDFQDETVSRLIVDQGRRPFDLENDRLVRLTIARLAPQEHALILTEHHLVHDGWTQGVLLKDFLTLYSAFVVAQPSPLDELPIQYADYAYWQRRWLQGEILQTQLDYWKEKLAGVPEVLNLPFDRPRPPVMTSNGAQAYLTLPGELADSIRALCRREGVTLYMTMQAAFITLLSRYSGQEDIVLGSGVANRRWRELEGLLGMIINTVVFRTQLSENPSFVELLRRVRETCLGAYAQQDTPFEKIVEVLQPERSPSYNPVFQIMYNFMDAPTTLIELPGLTFEGMESHNQSAKFDMTITVQPRAEQFAGSGITRHVNEILILWEYNTDLFDASTMDRMLEHYRVLIEGIMLEPKRRISELPLMREPERLAVLEESLGAESAYGQDGSLQEIFEAQVESTPDAIAAQFEHNQISYRELNRQANRLAHHLMGMGVGPEVVVGLLLPRSIDALIAVLATMKAGGVYMPMDSANPPERLALIAEDSQAQVFITVSSLAQVIQSQAAALVLLDAAGEKIALESDQNPVCRVSPDNAAYIIYTSGSTGRPKGVVGLHQATLNRFEWMWRAYPFRRQEACCQKTSTGAVDSIWETLGPVLGGTRLVILPDEDVKDLDRFVQILAMTQVTRIVLVPTMMRALLEAGFDLRDRLPALDLWTCSGEQLESYLSARFSEAMPEARLLNVYGMTEAAADATWHDTDDGASVDGYTTSTVPIGRAIDNLGVYLLDRELQPVPTGVSGEIFIGGEGLARCYFNRADSTAERFVPDSFSKHDGARLYRTGDLARRLVDGNIEYQGRADNLVKVRGFRVELDEIETVLRTHAGIREVALLASADRHDQVQLTAYVVPRQEHQVTSIDLRDFLNQRLPDYMIPSNFVFLENIPLTASGKLDRKSLPAPDEFTAGETGSYCAPRNHVEEIVAAIWGSIFGVRRVGINDNFFSLGGHSLLGTQVMSRIRQAFHVDLPLRTLFENLTVAALAETIQKAIKGGDAASTLEIEAVPRDELLPLSFSQQRLWFSHHVEQANHVFNIPYLIRMEGDLNVAAIEQSVNEIIRRHETLRTAFVLEARMVAQSVRPYAPQALRIVDLRDLPEALAETVAESLARKEARRSFDLANDSLLRLSLLRLTSDKNILVLTLHHIISDGWSGGIFVREFMALYNACHSGQRAALPELPIQYADFAAWQHQWMQTASAQAQLDYWRKTLAGVPSVFDLPTDYPRAQGQVNSGARLLFEVPEDIYESLKAVGMREQVTMFMVLFSAFNTLLHAYTGREDIVVATPIAGRTRVEAEGLVGLFVNMLLMRLRVSSEITFHELLLRAREAVLGAYANQDLPFDKLVSELGLTRNQERTPLTRISFDLHNEPIPEMELSGLRFSSSAIETGIARADLLVVMRADESRLGGYFEYSADLFSEKTISKMANAFMEILNAICADPQQHIESLTALGKESPTEISEELEGQATFDFGA